MDKVVAECVVVEKPAELEEEYSSWDVLEWAFEQC